ncbi:MAG TPA: hypothetical protein VFP00_07820 [Burkholderiales bacterium]|nr:hypothetical protein [Burkholderiales bacterium]
MRQFKRINEWRLIALGGLAGGAAEMLWVTLYSAAGDVSAAEIARQVTASLYPAAGAWTLAPALGIAIHMILALALAALCAPLLIRLTQHHATSTALILVAVLALTLVWAVNFFLVLPVLNPGFVTLMPYAATLVSKMLFGLAMAAVLQHGSITSSARTVSRGR